MLRMMQSLSAAAAVILAALIALAVRALVHAVLDRPRRSGLVVLRILVAGYWFGLAVLYALFSAHILVWTPGAVLAAAVATIVVLGPPVLRGGRRRGLHPTAALARTSMALILLLGAALTLMGAGFLALTVDRPVLLVDVTGETATQTVRWAPPNQAAREETLRTHQVIFRSPDGAPVAEAWLYGDEVAVKGRVLRLAPLLSAAGLPNLFELSFAHNGYRTAERHSIYPHTAVPLPPSGPLAVHPWWRPIQSRLLGGWERISTEGRPWAIRSLTIESTYFPLVDRAGNPLHHTYRLVLTPGGLSAS
jgi:hypothetical protein